MTSNVRDLSGEPRRLLVITYHLPPDGSVGGLRWAGLSKYLARRGWEVDVITASPQDAINPVPGVSLHHRSAWLTLNDVYNSWVKRLRAPTGDAATPSAAAASAPSSPDSARPAKAARWLRNNLSMALAFPDYGRGWIIPATIAARGLLRARTYHAIITSGPPHAAHLVGTLASVGRSVPHWVDMRDSWAAMVEQAWAQMLVSSGGMRFLIRRVERFVLRRAHRAVTNTTEFADVLRRSYPGLSVSYVPNGIDPDRLPPPVAQKFEGLSIMYAGSLYFGRDLSSVLLAMREFLEQHPDALGALKLRIAGNMDAEHEARFWRDVATNGLGDLVEVLGQVSGVDALHLINRSHLTLVLAQNQPMQVPAKLYECVAMGIPTLVVAESSSAAAREARRIGAITCEPADIAGIRTTIERLWWDRTPVLTPSAAIGYHDIAAYIDELLRGAVVLPDETTLPAVGGAPRSSTTHG